LPLEIAVEKDDEVLLAILLEHGGLSVGHRRIAHHPDHEHDDEDAPPTLLEYSVWVNNSEAFKIVAECFGLPTEEGDRVTLLNLLASRAAGTLPVEGRRGEYENFAVDNRGTWSLWRDICESGATGRALTLSDVTYLLNVPRKVKAHLQAGLWAWRHRQAVSEGPVLLKCVVLDAIQLVDAHWLLSWPQGHEESTGATESKVDTPESARARVGQSDDGGVAKKARTL
jgi:hypothetical protein